MPPTSRTNSSQSTPRAKGRASQNSQLSNGGDETLTGASVGSSHEPKGPQFSDDVVFAEAPSSNKKHHHSTKLKNQGKGKRERKERRTKSISHIFVDLLARVFLLWFTIYTLSVCPHDVEYESRVCRGLHEYRRIFLEPYVLPPIYAALDHPNVKPYVDTIKPHVSHAVEVATPIVQRGKAEFDKYVVPQWNTHVVPIAVRVDSQFIRPYRERAYQEYEERLAPHVNVAFYQLERWQRQAQPYILLAAIKTYNGYQVARPYAEVVLGKAKEGAALAASAVNQARREFIDPHVAKMLDKASELAGRETMSTKLKGTITPAPAVSSAVVANATAWAFASGVATSITDITTPSSQTVVSSTGSADGVSVTDIPVAALSSSAVVSIASAYSSASSSVSESLSSEAGASSIASAFDALSSSATSALSKVEETLSSASVLASSASSVASETISYASSVVAKTSATSGENDDVVSAESDIDLEAFYAELGIVETADELEEEPVTPPPPPPPQLSEEEKVELTRQRRVDVTKRHAVWEEKVQNLIKAKKKELRKNLVVMRKAGAAYIKSSPDVRAELAKLEDDTNKLFVGAEAVLKSLVRDRKDEQEKIKSWEMVTGKVDDRFTARLRQTEEYMHNIYMNYHSQELAEVEKLFLQCKDLAQDAQANIGMDYAWLDDVTYQDWERYHRLVGVCNDFLELGKTVQNGSHASPPVNPLLDSVEEYREEMSLIADGFEARFSTMTRDGTRAIHDSVQLPKMEPSTAPAQSAAPEVSILPIAGDDEKDGVKVDSDPVVIGRSVEEVEAAAVRAVGAAAPKEVLSPPSDAEKVVTSVAVEPAEGRTPQHVEL